MAQLQKVSWRTVGYAALGTAVAAASVIAIVNSDGVRPTAVTANSATRWLVDPIQHRLVLVDGLAGRVVAGITRDAAAGAEIAVQGAGGAFLVTPTQGSVRTISTPKLELGAAQTVAVASERGTDFRVGDNGLTIMNAATKEASVIASGEVAGSIEIPASDKSLIASDGSMWLFSNLEAMHVNVDGTNSRTALPIRPDQRTTVGSHAVVFDSSRRVVRWLDGVDVPLDSIGNASEAVLQIPSDDAPCAWLGTGGTLICVGPHGIDKTVEIDGGLDITPGDRLAIAGSAAAVIKTDNSVRRIDLDARRIGTEPQAQPTSGRSLDITATGHLIWIDDRSGDKAWVIHRFGTNTVRKTEQNIHLVDEQGHLIRSGGTGEGGDDGGDGGDAAPGSQQPEPDDNGQEDPPIANDDSVTARAGSTVVIPVTANDFDPDGGAIAVDTVGEPDAAGHGAVGVLDGSSVSYVPESGFSGEDSFSYGIVDQTGATARATVHVRLFPIGSPNRAPVGNADTAETRVDHAVTIDVLANDIDPERDELAIGRFEATDGATITETRGPTDLPALRYQPPPGKSGILEFTYQAVDPQGGLSPKTPVTIDISNADAANRPPKGKPDSTRLRVGTAKPLNVLANDSDPDGDELTISDPVGADAVTAVVRAGQLDITVGAGARSLSHLRYTLHDGAGGHSKVVDVLVIKISDDEANGPPVANDDTERVVVGNSVLVPVLANDIDPDKDLLLLSTVTKPADGAGTAVIEGRSIRFTPTLDHITEPTPVTFSYSIDDGHGHSATGAVTVTVLTEALPQPPFARDDFADTVVDKPVKIDVLANDSDPSGGRPTLVGNPSCTNGGDAVPTGDGKVTFTPPSGQAGTFRCVYTVSNSQAIPAKASIIVTVTVPPPGNAEPVLNDAALQRTVALGANVPFFAEQLATDPDGDSLVFASIGRPQFGTVTQDSSTAFTYRAPSAQSADPAPIGDTFQVIISDKKGGNVPAAVLIKIIPIPPTPPAPTPPATTPLAMTPFVGESTQIDVIGSIAALNDGATLKLVSVTADQPGFATVQLNGSSAFVTALTAGPGTLSYVVENTVTGTPAKNVIKVTAIARPVNPPATAVDDALTIPSGGSGSVNLLINDLGITDPGDAPPAVVLLPPLPGPGFGTVKVVNGILTLTAASRASGTRTVRYTVDDGRGPSAPAAVVLTIEACVDSPPVARSESIFTPYQTPLAIDLTKYVDSGTIRQGSISGAITDVAGTYTPPAGMNGNAVVNFTVENGCGDPVSATLTIDVNRPPVATTISPNVARSDTRIITVNELATDDEPLNITDLAGNPTWVSRVLPGSSPGALDSTTIRVSPPGDAATGTYSFTATIADPGGLTDVATINVRIANVAPTAVNDVYDTPFSQVTIEPTKNDSDSEPGPLTVVTVVRTAGVGALLDITANLVTVSVGHGVTKFDYTIKDVGGLTATATITITSNHAPSVADVALTTDQPTFTVTLTPFDPDIDDRGSLVMACTSSANLQVQNITPNPNPSSANEADRVDVHVKVLDQSFEGTETIPCTVTDPFGATAVARLVITIHN